MTRLRVVIWQIFRRAGCVRSGPAMPILTVLFPNDALKLHRSSLRTKIQAQ